MDTLNDTAPATASTELPHTDESQSNGEKLRKLFPEAFPDGDLDVATLLQLIGRSDAEPRELYGLTWHGKRDARQAALDPSIGTLRPSIADSREWDSTRNLFVEGDNLEALKLLQKAYYGRVKMIYIDPPYNTGKDFVYKDNYRDSIANYKAATGQTDENGRPYTSSAEATGRAHTAWLNMMYPRLKVARNLLRTDGVLFMSIDEREIGNARLLLAEIFGEQNAICEFVWHAKKGGGSDKGGVVTEHEYVLCFARDAANEPLGHINVEPEALDMEDQIGPYRRGRELNKWGANSLREDRETMYFPVKGPGGVDVFPIRNDGKQGRWRRGAKQMIATVERGDADFVPRGDGTFTVYEKIRSTDSRAKPHRTLLSGVGQTADGSKAIKTLFDGEKVFDFTKPPSLISALIELAAPPEPDHNGDTDFIVMDFFAGSGTTAEAVMTLNAQDDSDRRFVLIQLPEVLDPKDVKQASARVLCHAVQVPANLAEVSKERVRRAGTAVRSSHPDWSGDVGFRVLKLDSSNLQVWDPETQDLEASLLASLNHVKPGRTTEDLLFEILLRLGIDPTAVIHETTAGSQKVYVVDAGPLIACLDEDYKNDDVSGVANSLKDLANAIKAGTDVTVVLRDSAFANDVAKTNLIAALEQHGISSVKTI